MASLQLKNIYKIYPNGFNAVKDFNLDIEDKEFIIFVGPSGGGGMILLSYKQNFIKIFLVKIIKVFMMIIYGNLNLVVFYIFNLSTNQDNNKQKVKQKYRL